ncbi:60Kd inner membrane protein-domain-containing protein [Flammula alnicola]|nr:60Kd inner membrane protein-domain-containing protein [Flammula alnicola]
MLALHRARLRTHSFHVTRPGYRHPSLSNRRYFIQSVCNGFLDLALALPLPPSLPPYSTTIILVTIASRLALLPISIWGKDRTRRAEEIVIPEMQKLKPLVAKRVFEEMKSAGIRGDKKFLQKYHTEKSIQVLTARQKELFKEHRCSPLPSIIIPPLSQLPVFIGFTIMLSRLSIDPTPFDSESFLTLTSLVHPDPTMTLPVVLGFLTMANVESGNWVMGAAEREQQRKAEEQEAKRIAEGGKPRPNFGKQIKTVLRGLSVLRIIVAAITPGSVTIYWVTSAAFGLVQTWAMEWSDARRRNRRLLESQPSKESNSSPNQPAPNSNGKHIWGTNKNNRISRPTLASHLLIGHRVPLLTD